MADGRLYAAGESDNGECIVEVFPENNTMRFVAWFDPDEIDGITETVFTGDKSDEIGFSTERFLQYHSWFYNNQFWIEQNYFSVVPTIENVNVEWADREAFVDNPEAATWNPLSLSSIELDDREFVFSYVPDTLPDSNATSRELSKSVTII